MTDADADRPELTGVAAEVYDLIVHNEPVEGDTIFEEIPSYPRDEMSRSLTDLKREGLVKEVDEPIPELDGAMRTLVATESYEPQSDGEQTENSTESGQSPEQEDDKVVHQAEVTDESLAVIRRTLRDQQHKAATSEEYDALETALDELPEETLTNSEEFAKRVLP